MDHRTRRALQPSGLPPRATESHCRHASWAAGPWCSRWSSVTSTGTVPGGGRCGGAGCTASIAFRAVTILLYSSTGVGCIRSGSIRISGTQIGPPRSVIALFCCPALAIADCRSAGPQLERGRRADPLRQIHPRRAAATRVGRPGHHRGQPITPLTIPDAFPPDHSGRGPDDHRMPSDADRFPPTVDPK